MQERAGKGKLMAAAAAVGLALVLHAPWSGYTTRIVPEAVDTLSLLAACPQIGHAAKGSATHQELLRQYEQNLACASATRPVPVPIRITRWRSKEPLLSAFGRLRNVAAGILLIVLATAWAVRLERRQGNHSKTRPATKAPAHMGSPRGLAGRRTSDAK
jgi:hypothetical protein